MGTVITLVLAAACACCALLALSGFVRMARVRRAWREAAFWTAPLVFVSAAFALLTALGVLGLISGIVLSAIPLAVVTARAARAHREIAKLHGAPAATATVLGLLGARLRDALWNAREDVRELAGLLHRAPGGDGAAPAGAKRGAPAVIRSVPSFREDPRLGDVPAAAEVSADLEAAGAMVPQPWRDLADWVAEAEFEDEEELREFVAGCAAGVLTLAEAFQEPGEHLLETAGLDPALAGGFFEMADEWADMSAAFAMLDRRYTDAYAEVSEWAEDGVMPHNARRWFNAGGPEAA
jgi:hypothetical protein